MIKIVKKQLYARSPESPVFVSTYDIANIDGPETLADDAGHIAITALHGNTLRGYRCEDIKAMYKWCPNGRARVSRRR